MRLFGLFPRKYREEAGEGGEAGGGGGDSLIPGAGGEPGAGDSPGAGAGAGGENDNAWMWAEGVEGSGDRPDWFMADKYKSVEEQAKAYPELARKFGGFTGAPEGGYELSMPEGLEGELVQDDPLLVGFQDMAKEAEMSQDTFTKFLHFYLTKEADGIQTSRDNELSQLGDNATARLESLGNWARANLSEDKFQAFRQVATTAQAVEVLEDIIAAGRHGRLPYDEGGEGVGGMTAEKLKEMKFAKDEHGRRKTEVDPEYAKKVQKAYADFYGTEPKHQYVTGRGGK